MNAEQIKAYCKNHTPEEAVALLQKYVDDGQPEDFMPEFAGSRGMCAFIAEQYAGSYGGNFDYMDFYMAMWGGDKLGTPEERKARHIRCGMPLDS